MEIASIALLASVLTTATAHYTFSQLIVNDDLVGSDWTYIREHTRGYMPTKGSQILENDFRCQPGGESGANTDVYTVKPGDKIALKQAFGGTGMAHPGPAQVYMSKAPSSVKSYDGSGDWFKVSEQLLCSDPSNGAIQNKAWCVYMEDRIAFTLPATIPAGEYLVRAEHIPLHGAHEPNGPEFYYACAQVKVGGGSEDPSPSPTVKIPGVYSPDDPAVRLSVWDPTKIIYSETPGPKVVSGGEVRGSIDGSSD